MENPNNIPGTEPWVPQQEPGLSIVTHARELHVFRLTEEELDAICAAGNYKTLDLAMLCLCVGVFATLAVVLVTVDIPNIKIFSTLVSLTVVSLVGALAFGVRAGIAWHEAANRLKRIKQKPEGKSGGPQA